MGCLFEISEQNKVSIMTTLLLLSLLMEAVQTEVLESRWAWEGQLSELLVQFCYSLNGL
jgi:hypothetical protein